MFNTLKKQTKKNKQKKKQTNKKNKKTKTKHANILLYKNKKGLDKTESRIFVFFCTFFVSKGNLLDFYFFYLKETFFQKLDAKKQKQK